MSQKKLIHLTEEEAIQRLKSYLKNLTTEELLVVVCKHLITEAEEDKRKVIKLLLNASPDLIGNIISESSDNEVYIVGSLLDTYLDDYYV